MDILPIELPDHRKSEIWIGSEILHRIPGWIKNQHWGKKIFIFYIFVNFFTTKIINDETFKIIIFFYFKIIFCI